MNAVRGARARADEPIEKSVQEADAETDARRFFAADEAGALFGGFDKDGELLEVGDPRFEDELLAFQIAHPLVDVAREALAKPKAFALEGFNLPVKVVDLNVGHEDQVIGLSGRRLS